MNELHKELTGFATKHKLSSHIDALIGNAKEAIALIPTHEGDETIENGYSKLGGCPDVPPDFEWPKNHDGQPLSFIVQINLADVAKLDTAERLPNYGVLSFFYDNLCWGFSPKDKDGFRVFHFDDRYSKLTRMPPPEMPSKKMLGFIKIDQKVREFKPCRLALKKFLALPDALTLFPNDDDEQFWDAFYEMLESIGGHHRLLGYAEPIQDSMELQCELVTNGIYCGDPSGYKDPKVKELEGNASQWKLLLQIDSDTHATDMMWGDAGRLYVWIKEEDLRNSNFERCWLISQCH